jgi:integrase
MSEMHLDDSQDQPQQPQEETPAPKRSRKKSAPKKKRTRRRHGEGTVTLRKDGRYQADVSLGTDPKTGKRLRITRYGKTEDEAYEKLHQALEEQRKGNLIKGNRLTVGVFLNEWLENVHKPTLKLLTYFRYRDCLNLHIIPGLGHIQLQKLHQAQIQAFYAQKLDEGLAPSRVRFFHAILHKALDHAVKWEYVVKNVSDLVSLPRKIEREPQYLTKEQALHLLETLRGQKLEAIVSLALATGMRKGELLALRWSDIDLEDKTIQVRRTVSRLPEYGFYESEPKSKAGRRRIVLPDRIVEVLKQHRAEQEEVKRRVGEQWRNLDLVFTNQFGSYIEPNHVNKRFNAAVEAAGLPPMRFHDLRHSAATLLLAMNVHPKVVQQLLGHSNISITMDRYSHVLPSMGRDAMDDMDDFLNGNK